MTLLLGNNKEALAHEESNASATRAFQFTAPFTGIVETLEIFSGATANTCTSLRLGIYTSEGEIPGGAGSKPQWPIGEGTLGSKPGTKEWVKVTGLSIEVEEGVTYWIAFQAVGGNFHFYYENASGGTQVVEGEGGSKVPLVKQSWTISNIGPVSCRAEGKVVAATKGPLGYLGLMGNHFYGTLGATNDFSRYNILWDRGNELEVTAGSTVTTGVGNAISAGMKPILLIEYTGYSAAKLPQTTAEIETYAKEFVKTVEAVEAVYPGKVLYEIINEPYFRLETTAARYAAIVEEVFKRCETAAISLSKLLVAGRGHSWISEMYAAQPALETKIENWSFHPYSGAEGPGNWNSAGIQSLIPLRAEIKSGKNSIYVTEFGWWVEGVNGAKTKESPEAPSAAIGKEYMEKALAHASRYHGLGWLKSMIIYSRGSGGWAMEESGSKITESGEALIKQAIAEEAGTAHIAIQPRVISRAATFRSVR